MRRRHGQRARLGGVLLAALGAVALLALPSVAAAKDRNNDRIPDRWEKRHNLSLKVKQTTRDQDRDHLRNRAEFLSGNDPRDTDSDDDGVMDDDENAGRIASFDPGSGRLVIDLFGGDSVAGIVNGATRIECDEDEDQHSEASASHEGGDNSGPSDNSGPGSDDSGPNDQVDDHDADQPGEHEQGEDHHGRDDDANCTTAALVEGAVVEEAELELANGVATFEEVELAD
jgi:hypothetical protein